MKSKQYYGFIFLLVVTFLSACKNTSEEVTIDNQPLVAKELKDVPYGSSPQQVYDIYLPKDRQKTTTKVIVIIHGGGWTSGDKSELQFIVEYLKNTTDAYAIVNLNYTLANLAVPPIPMQTNEIAEFITHLKGKQDEYQVKPTFALIGTSAGAHLSMLYGYKFDANRDVKVICNVVGPTDFLHESYLNTSERETQNLIQNVQTLFGIKVQANPQFYQSISPLYWVTAEAPATISFYGGNDLLVPEQQGEVLKDKLDNFQVTNAYYLYPVEGHGWGSPNFEDTFDKITDFLKNNFD